MQLRVTIYELTVVNRETEYLLLILNRITFNNFIESSEKRVLR